MRSLLDINVLIALLDPDHSFHTRAHQWWTANGSAGWASCPLTENGVVRIMSNPSYRINQRLTPADLVAGLKGFVSKTDHEFWPDEVSLRDDTVFSVKSILGPGKLTDFYLLALAVRHDAVLATFDTGIPLSAVKSAQFSNLCVI